MFEPVKRGEMPHGIKRFHELLLQCPECQLTLAADEDCIIDCPNGHGKFRMMRVTTTSIENPDLWDPKDLEHMKRNSK